jgi:CO/xanthine dehydrogenase Mo-binding subunit
VDDVAVFGADTDASPYDSGSYASSTTYVTGKAVEKACTDLKKNICAIAAGMMNCAPEEVVFERGQVRRIETEQVVSLEEIAYKSQICNTTPAEATAAHTSPIHSPFSGAMASAVSSV